MWPSALIYRARGAGARGGRHITGNATECRAFFARRRGGELPNRGETVIAATVGEKWIGLSRRLGAGLMGFEWSWVLVGRAGSGETRSDARRSVVGDGESESTRAQTPGVDSSDRRHDGVRGTPLPSRDRRTFRESREQTSWPADHDVSMNAAPPPVSATHAMTRIRPT